MAGASAAAAASAIPNDGFEEMAEYQLWQKELREHRSLKELTKSRELNRLSVK